MKYILLFLLLACCQGKVFAQTDSASLNRSTDFLFFLLENKQLDDVKFLGDHLLNDKMTPQGFRDSVAFIIGESLDELNNDSTAVVYYKMVSDESPFIYASRLKTAYYETGIKKYDDAFRRIDSLFTGDDTLLTELKTLQLAGVSLLKNDVVAFDSITAGFMPGNAVINNELDELNMASLQLQTSKRKSPVVAGLLSALVPGLGKVYTGKKGEGVSAFLKVVPLAAIALENYSKNGWKDPQFLIFTSLFGLFYTGNIWGSTLSAQIVYDERINKINHNIRVSLSMSFNKLFR